MIIEDIIITYGYPALLVGTFVEGETVLILGGVAAHLGYLSLPGVLGTAFAGSLLGDQTAFFLGRRFGRHLLERKPRLRARVARVQDLMSRFRVHVALGFRFVYGMRNIIPFAMGMGPIPWRKFLGLNAVGAVLWVAVIGTGGYLLGKGMEAVLGNVKEYEEIALAGLAAAGILFWVFNHLRSRRKDRSFHRS